MSVPSRVIKVNIERNAPFCVTDFLKTVGVPECRLTLSNDTLFLECATIDDAQSAMANLANANAGYVARFHTYTMFVRKVAGEDSAKPKPLTVDEVTAAVTAVKPTATCIDVRLFTPTTARLVIDDHAAYNALKATSEPAPLRFYRFDRDGPRSSGGRRSDAPKEGEERRREGRREANGFTKVARK